MSSPIVRRRRRNVPLLAQASASSTTATVGLAQAASRTASAVFAADARTLLLAVLRAGDMVVLYVSALIAAWMRLGTHEAHRGEHLQIVTGCLIAANLLHFARLYRIESLRQRGDHLRRLAGAWVLTVLAVIATVYFTRSADAVSRGWLVLWAFFGFIALMLVRAAAWSWLGSRLDQERFMLKVAVVGNGTAAERLAQHLERSNGSDTRVVGVFSLGEASPGQLHGGAASPDIDELVRLARRERIDEIAISMPCPFADVLSVALAKVSTIPINVKLCTDLTVQGNVGGIGLKLPPVCVFERPLAGWPILVKRCMDVAVSGLLLMFLAPVLALIALVIKLDSQGPVLFRQQRFGFNQNPFTVYKFRTMHAAAALDTDAPQARRNDPRVTSFGRFLRRSSLDELPQLFNVLGGTMSLVGPRPHAIAHDEYYAKLIDGYLGRHRVRPGITGWAQVNGCRGETDTIEKMARRVEHDLFYIDHWSPFFDLFILARTAVVGFRDNNAY